MKVTDIYEAMNSKAEAFFEWLQAHPKYGLLFGVGLLALWLAGLLFMILPYFRPMECVFQARKSRQCEPDSSLG